MVQTHQTYKISGVPVLFPCKPYPSQFSMMDRIIKGIERRQNCLLESPTGSGKSLALLCSSLAWLMEEKAKKEKEDLCEIDKGMCTCACHVGSNLPKNESPSVNSRTEVKEVTDQPSIPTDDDFDKDLSMTKNDHDEDEFKSDLVNFNTKSSSTSQNKPRKHISISYEENDQSDQSKKNVNNEEQNGFNCKECYCSSSSPLRRKIPKIYFGTRTHKQVAQIVKELKRTEYREVKMTILGSREHTCIHPSVSKMKNKNDGCKDLLNGPGCSLKDKAQRFMSHQIIKDKGLPCAWDLEDLIAMCKPKKVCPYFLSRGLKEEADLVICPYNYLVDPLIREAMSLSLKGHVVILDEAHNIEDSAREAASQSIPQETILAAIKDMEVLMESHNLADYSRLVHVMRNLDKFIEENKGLLEQKEFNQSYKIWNGFHVVAELEAIGMGPKHFDDLKKALASIKADSEERKETAIQQGVNPDTVEMKTATLNLIEQLFMVMDFLYRHDLKYVDDYRASLVHSVSYVPRHENNQWLNSRKKNGGRNMMQVDMINLNFWCMNPGVAFSDFSETRSVILTSGTLSPMTSFQSELGLDFKIQLEANHIIKDSQVWVGTLGEGPNGTSLMAVYRNLDAFAFQDELGQLVLQVCKTVPHGVLCFFPSYKVLDKLYTRWESTGLLDKIGERKKVLREPRSSSKEDFEEQILSYYRAVDGIKDPDCTTDGAIMLAVCRGKISEGLDFADNFARAVISVGIPYPNFKDIQVELKRKYNDQHRHERSLMSGGEWYEIQAFRALNQALGRCIRHRNDWGALIIVDDRFVKSGPKYTKGLSKWVRNKVCNFDNYTCGMDSLSEFVSSRKKAEKETQNDTLISPFPSSTPVTPKIPEVPLDAGTESNPSTKDGDWKKSKPFENRVSEMDAPKYKQFSIFNFKSPKVSKSPSTKMTASSSNTPSPSPLRTSTSTTMNFPTHQVPMAIVHPSFVVPPKPLAPISIDLNKSPVTGNAQSNQTRSNNGQKVEGISNDRTIHFGKSPNPSLIRNGDNNRGSADTKTILQDRKNSKVNDRNTNSTPLKTVQNSGNASKTILKIVTEKAPPGKRMQVFEIAPNLHSVFGGNLNLPVSSTERLVYMVEPPPTTGGNPLARIIKMSEEEKDKIVKTNQQFYQQKQQPGKDVCVSKNSHPKCEEQSTKSNLGLTETMKTISSSDSTDLPNKLVTQSLSTVSTPCAVSCSSFLPSISTSQGANDSLKPKTSVDNTSNTLVVKDTSKDGATSNAIKTSLNVESSNPGYQASGNEETQHSDGEQNSSSSLFSTPTNVSTTKELQHSVLDISDVQSNGKNSSPSDSVGAGSNKKSGNPLLRFFNLSLKKSSSKKAKTIESPSSSSSRQDRELCNDNTGINTSVDPSSQQSTVTNKVSNSAIRKPLFKVRESSHQPLDIHNVEHSSFPPLVESIEKSQVNVSETGSKSKMESSRNEAKLSNIRVSSKKSLPVDNLESSPLASQTQRKKEEEGEENLLVVRRKCGRKRKMALMRVQDEDNDNDDDDFKRAKAV